MGMRPVAILEGSTIKVVRVDRRVTPQNFVSDLPDDFTEEDAPHIVVRGRGVEINWEELHKSRVERSIKAQEAQEADKWNSLSVLERMKQSFKGGES